MALQITSIERKFIYKQSQGDITLADVAGMTPEQVIDFYSDDYPELVNASIGNIKPTDTSIEYHITAHAKTKG